MATKPQVWFDQLEELRKADILPVRVLLFGPPGTGKTTYGFRAFPAVESITITEDAAPEDFIGNYLLKDGSTVWVDGPAVRAWKQGIPIIINEVNRYSPAVESFLHNYLDDPDMARMTLPTGAIVTPKAGWRAIATMNGATSELSEPVRDRFDLHLYCGVPAPGILDALTEDARKLLKNYYTRLKAEPMANPITSRKVQVFDRLRKALGDPKAAALVFGAAAKDILADLAGASAPKEA